MTNAAITPGTQPQNVKSNTIKNDPQPLPMTDKGGNMMASSTRKKLIRFGFLIDVFICRLGRRFVTKSPIFI